MKAERQLRAQTALPVDPRFARRRCHDHQRAGPVRDFQSAARRIAASARWKHRGVAGRIRHLRAGHGTPCIDRCRSHALRSDERRRGLFCNSRMPEAPGSAFPGSAHRRQAASTAGSAISRHHAAAADVRTAGRAEAKYRALVEQLPVVTYRHRGPRHVVLRDPQVSRCWASPPPNGSPIRTSGAPSAPRGPRARPGAAAARS